MTEAAPLEFVWDQVAWQVDLLYGCPDHRDEALGYGFGLVDALAQPATSARAEHALRTAGDLGAMVLGMAAWDMAPAKVELRRRCWVLFSQLADATAVKYLLGGIVDEDAEIRVATVLGVERITGIASGRDAAFWRDGPAAERFDVVRRWRERLRDF